MDKLTPEQRSRNMRNIKSKNIERDKKVNKSLKKAGWKVFRLWVKDINKNIDCLVDSVYRHIKLN